MAHRLFGLRFDGATISANPTLLAPHVANGVGVELLDINNNPVTFGQDPQTDACQTVSVFPGAGAGIVFNLHVHYKSYALPVTPGLANVSTKFTIVYK